MKHYVLQNVGLLVLFKSLQLILIKFRSNELIFIRGKAEIRYLLKLERIFEISLKSSEGDALPSFFSGFQYLLRMDFDGPIKPRPSGEDFHHDENNDG